MSLFHRIFIGLLTFPVVAVGVWAEVATPATEVLYPAMTEWTKAGVTGGIPSDLPVVARLHPGDDVQAAIDRAASSGGVIMLAAGEYLVNETIRLRSGVILQGAGRMSTELQLKLRGTRPPPDNVAGFSAYATGILFESVERAGLVGLTITFDKSLPEPPRLESASQTYSDNPDGLTDLHVIAVHLAAAKECWLRDCAILNSGTHPLAIEASRNITLEDVAVRGAYNKGTESGMISVWRSMYVLMSGLDVRDINHVVFRGGTIAQPCRYNVLEGCRFEVDIRFHDAGTTDNLMENCVVTVPSWHNRPPLSQGRAEHGVQPPGPGNLIYLCTITRNFPSGGRNFSIADNPTKVYAMLERFSNVEAVTVVGPAPSASTLFTPR